MPSKAIPKYHRLKEHLRERILRGEFKRGDQLPSENTLAKQFRVSRHTIRQALGDLENDGLIYREQGRGTFCAPNRNNGKTIAVITTYISEYIFPTVIRGIEDVLSAAGCALVLANTGNDKTKEALCLENLLQREIAGLIIEPTKSARENVNLGYYREIERRNLPYVMLHAAYHELEPAYIIMDDERGGYMATQYLLQLGHRRIAGIFKADDLQGVRRQAGFAAALREYGLALEPELLGNYETEQISSFPYQFAHGLLRLGNRPTAIVCYNDQIALTVLEAIRENGLRVPEHISIIGYDDSSLAVSSETKLTTIRHPKTEMGRQAARFILDMLDGRVAKPRFVYQPELIIRSSCRARA
ncbi:MAG: GntR family transcriptional regulator [Bacteroidota bacterium]